MDWLEEGLIQMSIIDKNIDEPLQEGVKAKIAICMTEWLRYNELKSTLIKIQNKDGKIPKTKGHQLNCCCDDCRLLAKIFDTPNKFDRT